MRAVKIQLMSDLHLESHPAYRARPAPDAELLVLAGDVGSYQRGSQLQGEDFGLERFSPKHGWPVPVLYVQVIAARMGCDIHFTRPRRRSAHPQDMRLCL